IELRDRRLLEDPRAVAFGRAGQPPDEPDGMDLPVPRIEETGEEPAAGEEALDRRVVEGFGGEAVLVQRAGAAVERLGLLLAQGERVAPVGGVKAVELLRLDEAGDQRMI